MSTSTPATPKKSRLFWIVAAIGGTGALASFCACGGAAAYYFTRPADFDPNSLDSTARWATAASQRAAAVRGNEIALGEHLAALSDECNRYVGKQVRWSVPVEAIAQEHVDLKARWCDGPRNVKGQATSPTLTLLREGAPPPDLLSSSLPLSVGDEISRDRAARLQPGSTVTVQATISDIHLRPYDMPDGSHAIDVQIILRDIRAE